MNDIDKALAAARGWRSDKCLRTNLAAMRKHDAEAAKILTNLIAAIDAQQAPPAAVVVPSSFVSACTRLRGLVEGVGCERWQNSSGFRLKDTEEWVAFYVELVAVLAAYAEGGKGNCACARYFARHSCGANVGEGECDCPKCQGYCDCQAAAQGKQ